MKRWTTNATAERVAGELERAGIATAISPGAAPLVARLLRRLSLGRPISAAEARSIAAEIGDGARLLDAVQGQSERDAHGAIVGLAGLSLEDHPHWIEIGGRELRAWCAWDTVFLPPILHTTAHVISRDPGTGDEIRLTVTPRGVTDVSRDGVVLSVVAPDLTAVRDAASLQETFCQYVHFFTGPEAAERWFGQRQVAAYLLTLEQGFELGRSRFSELIDQA